MFADLCTSTPTELQRKVRVRPEEMKKTQREHEKEDERFYRRGGEVETTPVLPCDEVDRLASQSAGLSTSGGVRGTRSGLPDCTPEEKKDINMAITESLTSLSKAECSLE